MDKGNNIRLVLLLATIAVLGYAFIKAQAVDFEELAQKQSQLETLRQLELSIDRDVLKIRAGLDAKDDPIGGLTDRMTRLLSQLRSQPMESGTEAVGDLGTVLKPYAALLEKRKFLLERFKSRNTSVRDSVRSFPAIADNLRRGTPNTGDGGLRQAVADVEVAVLRYHVNAAAGNNIGWSIQRLQRLAKRAPKPIADQLRALLRHGEVIVAHRTEADWTLKELLSVDGRAMLSQVLATFKNDVIELRRQSDSYRLLMFIAAVVLVGYIAFTFVNLVQVRQDLQRANVELEERIVDISRSKEEAELANRSKSEFLAMMSHELRTPLNAVIGFSDIIRMETFGPTGNKRYTEYAVDIHDSARHLLSLINDILDLSKIERGNLKPEEQELEIAPVVEAVETLVKDRAARGQVSLQLDCPDGLPKLRADSRQVKQMLVNLLSNAIKFTEPGGAVTVRVRVRDNADEGLVFEVHDTGIGMAEDDIPKALTPFMQIDSSLGRKHEGTGLGLPLTKRLIELHGGGLTLESEPGGGTTARLLFPATNVIRSKAKPVKARSAKSKKKPPAKKAATCAPNPAPKRGVKPRRRTPTAAE